jgi:hypothetical protein
MVKWKDYVTPEWVFYADMKYVFVYKVQLVSHWFIL